MKIRSTQAEHKHEVELSKNDSTITTNTISKLYLFMPQKSCNCAPGTHNTVWRTEEN